MWTMLSIAQQCKRHKNYPAQQNPVWKQEVPASWDWMFAPITLPHTVDQCKEKKFPKDLCQISSLANDRKDEDLSQLSWVRVYPTLLHAVLLLFLSLKLESREIPASLGKHFREPWNDSRLRPQVHDICKDLWDTHYCCRVAEYSSLSQSDGNAPSWNSSRS